MPEKLITKSFERLLDKGKNRGFITYEELGKSLGKRNSTNENIERAFIILVDEKITFDPTILDGKATVGLPLNKSNWAQKFDTPPYRAFPVTGGITFTYGGLKVNGNGEVLNKAERPITGLYACGEMIGGVFFGGYPGGSGLTSGTVFGRQAGAGAATF